MPLFVSNWRFEMWRLAPFGCSPTVANIVQYLINIGIGAGFAQKLRKWWQICHQKQHFQRETRDHRAMKKDNLVKTTWRIPADLYAEMQAIHEREKVSINTIGIERLRAASVSDRFDKLDDELVALRQMVRELLDRIELRK